MSDTIETLEYEELMLRKATNEHKANKHYEAAIRAWRELFYAGVRTGGCWATYFVQTVLLACLDKSSPTERADAACRQFDKAHRRDSTAGYITQSMLHCAAIQIAAQLTGTAICPDTPILKSDTNTPPITTGAS